MTPARGQLGWQQPSRRGRIARSSMYDLIQPLSQVEIQNCRIRHGRPNPPPFLPKPAQHAISEHLELTAESRKNPLDSGRDMKKKVRVENLTRDWENPKVPGHDIDMRLPDQGCMISRFHRALESVQVPWSKILFRSNRNRARKDGKVLSFQSGHIRTSLGKQ